MAAANYMTELDTENIWTIVLDTTQFGNIGVRIAEQLNFWVNDDATSQVTNTAITPILEQISEEILFDLLAAAKGTDVIDPWTWMQANIVRVSVRILKNYGVIFRKIKKILGSQYNVKFSNKLTLPSHSD